MATESNSGNGSPTPVTGIEAGRQRSRLTVNLTDESRRKLSRIAQSKNVSVDRFLEQILDGFEVPEGGEEPTEVRLRFVRLRVEELAQVLADFLGEISGEPSAVQKASIDSLSAQIDAALRDERELKAELSGLQLSEIPTRVVTVGEGKRKITIPANSSATATRQGQGENSSSDSQQKRKRIFI